MALDLTVPATGATDHSRRRTLALGLAAAAALLLTAGLWVGSEGWAWPAEQAALIVGQIRAPRSLGALAVGALLGLAGALAQGLFRNPLADPFLIGTAAGASLAVVVVLAAGVLGASAATQWFGDIGLAAAAFSGALGGMLLTLLMARGAQHSLRLLLAGVVVGMVCGAVADLLVTLSPQAMRGRQFFMLGSTALLGWHQLALLGAGLALALPAAWRLSRGLDALALGEDTATSLGLPLARLRGALVLLLALATGLAVSQAGLVAFVGLVSPHLVRRFAPAPHGYTLLASAATGGVLLLGADVLARGLLAPLELPVGVLTALLGGGYLLWLLHRRAG